MISTLLVTLAAQAMPGMAMPEVPATAPTCPPEHAAMGHCKADPDPVAAAPPRGTDQDVGDGTAPPPPSDRYADRTWGAEAMAPADAAMRREHGGMTVSQLLFNIAEVQVRGGETAARWDAEGWWGGDLNRVVVKSEGETTFGKPVRAAETQALYARALDPYWNLQAGARQDLGAGRNATYAVLGVEGLAPYQFEVEGALFLSTEGRALARAEAWYDQKITQRLIAQPRVELNLAAQDDGRDRIGAGLSTAEVGLRLRYEIRREFAPYVGVSWERAYGATARYARSDKEATGGVALVMGLRGWF